MAIADAEFQKLVDAFWDEVAEELRRSGLDPNEVLERAARNLELWQGVSEDLSKLEDEALPRGK